MSNASLMESLKFTDEDLTYNRRGEFSPRQRAQEKTDTQGCRRSSGIFVLVAVAVIALGILTRSELIQGLSVPLGILGIIAAGAFLLSFSKSSLKVANVRGTAKLTMNQDRGSTFHVVIVAGTHFRIPLAAYNAIEEGANYAVYYIPMGRNQILSMERVE